MAGKVFFSVTMSLDGFIAPEERRDDPDVQRWMAQWMELQQWIFPLRFFRENLKLGEGGEEGRDNRPQPWPRWPVSWMARPRSSGTSRSWRRTCWPGSPTASSATSARPARPPNARWPWRRPTG
ncbi:MAG TPA: hypothetical protein VIY52_30385 [Streptosporangiaceae bacterium]